MPPAMKDLLALLGSASPKSRRALLPSGHEAARHGRMDTLMALTQEQRLTLLTTRDDKGWLPVHIAARNGHLEALRYIVSETDRLNTMAAATKTSFMATTSTGLTVAHLAARGGFKSILRYMTELEGIAVLSAEDREGWTPAHSAARGGHVETLRYIFDQVEDREALVGGQGPRLEHIAANYHHEHVLRFLEVELRLTDRTDTSDTSDEDWSTYQVAESEHE